MTEKEEHIPLEPEMPGVRPVRKQKRVSKSLHDILGGDYLSKEFVISNIPFMLYIAVLAIIYIGNTYYAEKTFKEIEKTKTELKELRFQYLTTKSSLMFFSKQSEIASRVEKSGLKLSTVPPYRIFYSSESIRIEMDSNITAR